MGVLAQENFRIEMQNYVFSCILGNNFYHFEVARFSFISVFLINFPAFYGIPVSDDMHS